MLIKFEVLIPLPPIHNDCIIRIPLRSLVPLYLGKAKNGKHYNGKPKNFLVQLA